MNVFQFEMIFYRMNCEISEKYKYMCLSVGIQYLIIVNVSTLNVRRMIHVNS